MNNLEIIMEVVIHNRVLNNIKFILLVMDNKLIMVVIHNNNHHNKVVSSIVILDKDFLLLNVSMDSKNT